MKEEKGEKRGKGIKERETAGLATQRSGEGHTHTLQQSVDCI